MSVIYLHCCGSCLDLDFNCDEAIYYGPENEYYCFEHLLDKLMDEKDLTEEQAERLIDQLA